jgi:outer membrane phospholipase A
VARFCAACLLASLPAMEVVGATELVLRAPQVITASSELEMELTLLNDGPDIVHFYPGERVRAEIAQGANRWAVTLEAASPAPALIAPGTFARRAYRLHIPGGVAAGPAALQINEPGLDPARTLLEVRTARVAAAEESASGAPIAAAQEPLPAAGTQTAGTMTNTVVPKPLIAGLRRTFADRLAPYEPIYFVYGAGEPSVKFQFSFKYHIVTLGEGASWVMPPTLQFAYTQRSLWEIGEESSPFYDTSYMPAVFIEALAPESAGDGWFHWLGAAAGAQHESNGRDGDSSRSLNTLFLRPAVAIGKIDGWHLIIAPTFYSYIFGLEDNPQLRDYRGYGQLQAIIGRNDGPALSFTGWTGKSGENYSYQFDLSYPVEPDFMDFRIYLMAQYFNGYGESLLDYDQRSEMLRAGISLVR